MLAAFLALAQVLAPTPAPPRAVAARVAQAPTLDGRLDDDAWRAAPEHSTFTQKFPNERAAPSERTSFRIVYDDDAVFVGIDCEQKETPKVRRLTRRDRIVESDRVVVAIDARGDGRSAVELTVSSAGVLADALRFNDTEIDTDWDETWDARVLDREDGWSAEIRIPLRMLRFSSASSQTWGLEVRRYLSARQETDEWAFIPRAAAGEVSRYGSLAGIERLSPGGRLELRPFVVGRVDRRDPGSETVGSGARFDLRAGADLKWHLRQDLTLDASLLPDFAQVEADQLVLNLTNEEIELPEKRPFFFEGKDLFATPLPLLYTRRIGRIAPATPPLLDKEALVDPTRPATLLGAQKLTGRLGERTFVGALGALSADNDVSVRRADGTRVRRPLEPRTLFSVLRLKQELSGNAHVGALATAVTRAEDTGAYALTPPTTLCPNEGVAATGRRCFHDAYVGAVDARFRSDDGAYAASAQIVGSAVRGGPARALRDGSIESSGAGGYGAYATVAKEGGEPWIYDLTYRGASRHLDYNDAGLMTRQALHSFAGNLEHRTLSPWFVTIETHSRLEIFLRKNLVGATLAEGYQINTKWKFPSFWTVFTEVHWRRRHVDDREVGDGTALERADLVGFELELASDPRRTVSFELETQAQKIFDGFAFHGEGTINVRVLPQLDVALLPEILRASGEPRFAGRTADSLVFGKLEATEISGTARVTYTFTPRVSLQTYAQLFLAQGHYAAFSSFPVARAGIGREVLRADLVPAAAPAENPDFTQAALNANVVLRWEYALGSTLFFVYTRSQSPKIELLPGQRGILDATGLGRAPAVDTILIKISHFFG